VCMGVGTRTCGSGGGGERRGDLAGIKLTKNIFFFFL
jgi:hypothetical protein